MSEGLDQDRISRILGSRMAPTEHIPFGPLGLLRAQAARPKGQAMSEIVLHVRCKIIEQDEVKAWDRKGRTVWTWCTSGRDNWVEPHISVFDALAYLLPESPIPLPPDAEEFLPEDDDDR